MNTFVLMIQQTMLFAVPLLLAALGGLFSERSGVVNIALEGIMVMGAFAGVLFLSLTQDRMGGQLHLLAAVLIAAAAGMLFSLFHAIAAVSLKADQTISGTALNLFAPAFAVFMAKRIGGTRQILFRNTFRIASVPLLGKIPVLGRLFFQNAYLTTYLGLAILAVSAVVLYATRFGLRLRACGEHPQAAASAGVSVNGIRFSGVLISGALAGIGGLVYIIPTTTSFGASVSGYGFLALAVLIFGQWHPAKVLGASLFFGWMKTIAASYSVVPLLASAGIPGYFYKMIPYLATLLVLVVTSKKGTAPQAAGIPYDKNLRN